MFAVVFCEEEKDLMARLKPKSYKLLPQEMHNVYLGIVDILFAYCYNDRITLGEPDVSSIVFSNIILINFLDLYLINVLLYLLIYYILKNNTNTFS